MKKEELLYHYFSNSLTKTQEAKLYELLKTDVDFKKQFEFENNLKRAAKEERHKALKSKLNKFESGITSNKKIKNPSFSYLKIAANIVLLITAGWFGYQSFFGLNYTNLYTDNYNTYPNTVYAITRSDSINSIEREAFVAYEAENYPLAIEKFNNVETKSYVSFYKAQALLKLEEYTKAKVLFETIIQENKMFKAESNWYLALIYLKEKDKEQALFYLKQLTSSYDYKKEDAEHLIKTLE